MTPEEKDRLAEIVFYLYFDNKSEETITNRDFWEVINSICKLYSIDSIAITKAVRILMAEENAPQEDETYYLLHNIGLTVRPIKKLTGIYWQKQKAIEEKLSKTPITIHRRINDVIVKRNMRAFLEAMHNLSDSLFEIGNEIFTKILTGKS